MDKNKVKKHVISSLRKAMPDGLENRELNSCGTIIIRDAEKLSELKIGNDKLNYIACVMEHDFGYPQTDVSELNEEMRVIDLVTFYLKVQKRVEVFDKLCKVVANHLGYRGLSLREETRLGREFGYEYNDYYSLLTDIERIFGVDLYGSDFSAYAFGEIVDEVCENLSESTFSFA